MKIYELCFAVSAFGLGLLAYYFAGFWRWSQFGLLRAVKDRWSELLLVSSPPIHLGCDELVDHWELSLKSQLLWKEGHLLSDSVALVQIPNDCFGYLSEPDLESKLQLVRETGFARVTGSKRLALTLLPKSKRFEILLESGTSGGGICTKTDNDAGHASINLEATISVHFSLLATDTAPKDSDLELLFSKEVTLLNELKSRMQTFVTEWVGQRPYAEVIVNPRELVDRLNDHWSQVFAARFPELVGWTSFKVSWVVLNPPEVAEQARLKVIGQHLVNLGAVHTRLSEEQAVWAKKLSSNWASIELDYLTGLKQLVDQSPNLAQTDVDDRTLNISTNKQPNQVLDLYTRGVSTWCTRNIQSKSDLVKTYDRLDQFWSELESERRLLLDPKYIIPH